MSSVKTASFSAVLEARKVASGQLSFYKAMMTDKKKVEESVETKRPERASSPSKKTTGK